MGVDIDLLRLNGSRSSSSSSSFFYGEDVSAVNLES